MSKPVAQPLRFADVIASLPEQILGGERFWEYEVSSQVSCSDISASVTTALHRPDDFPPIESAIVPGDHVVLAIDPNVPQLDKVVRGVLNAISKTEASHVDVVLWNEATEEVIEMIQGELGASSRVVRHAPADRRSLCYLAADEEAEPVYLNRLVVEADFVLPIVAARPIVSAKQRDPSGIFPELADSATRIRYQELSKAGAEESTSQSETTWLLGVQMITCVAVNADGNVSDVFAGTPLAVERRLTEIVREPDDVPPSAPIVIASLDGDSVLQTWPNVARAAIAASRYVDDGGTIVLWTDIDSVGIPVAADSDTEEDDDDQKESGSSVKGPDGDFPAWDPWKNVYQTLKSISGEYRLLLRSHVDESTVELMGLAPIQDTAQLIRLVTSLQRCGILRAAQFADSQPYHVAPHDS